MRRGALLSIGILLALVVTLASAASIRVTSEELHRGGGVPPGWKFSVPAGDPVKGKEVFASLECYSCHEVAGASFPPKASDKSGPALTGMGTRHPAEYFAESILDPDAVLLDVPDFIGQDGRSTMPSYNDSLTVEQWVNLVAYLKSLTGDAPRRDRATHASHDAPGAQGAAAGHEGHGSHEMQGPERDKTVGEYRVRLEYTEPGQDKRPGYLTVSISDPASGQPIPYLPVRVRIGSGKAARSVPLAPVIGPTGLHYGAAAVVPDETESVTVLVGAATVKSVQGKYRTPRQVSFEW